MHASMLRSGKRCGIIWKSREVPNVAEGFLRRSGPYDRVDIVD